MTELIEYMGWIIAASEMAAWGLTAAAIGCWIKKRKRWEWLCWAGAVLLGYGPHLLLPLYAFQQGGGWQYVQEKNWQGLLEADISRMLALEVLMIVGIVVMIGLGSRYNWKGKIEKKVRSVLKE